MRTVSSAYVWDSVSPAPSTAVALGDRGGNTFAPWTRSRGGFTPQNGAMHDTRQRAAFTLIFQRLQVLLSVTRGRLRTHAEMPGPKRT